MRQLPQSIEAEVALLGTLLVYPETSKTVSQYGLEARDFFKREHQQIFESMSQIIEEHKTIDLTTLVAKLNDNKVLNEIGGLDYLAIIADGSGTPGSFSYYVEIVQEKSQKRNLIYATQAITESGFDSTVDADELIDNAERAIKKIAMNRRTEDMQKSIDVVNQVQEQIKEYAGRGRKITGVDTGYRDLNMYTNGLQRGDLIILAARPSVGKTAFALNLALNVASLNDDGNASVAIFSLEMPATHLMTRMLSAESRVHGTTLRHGNLTNDEWARLNNAVGVLRTRNIFIDDSSSITLSEIYAKCRKLKDEGGLDLVVIDYIQLISSRGRSESRQQEVSEISRGLKQLARDMEVPVIALSQLSRQVESRDGNMPQLSDLRESGSLEQDADIVLFLYREAYHNRNKKNDEEAPVKKDGEAEETLLLIRKHRNGGLGDVKLAFEPKFNRFYTTDDRDKGSY